MAVSCPSYSRSSTCPPWLQAALTDIEQRFHDLTLPLSNSTSASDSFANRAENYYQKRPQLLALLHDLRLHFLHLADRYSHSLLKLNPSSTTTSELSDDTDGPPLSSISTLSDDAESFHNTIGAFSPPLDSILVDLTMSLVAQNMLEEELRDADLSRFDSLRKIELQKSLLELMESERVVLVTENERLGLAVAMKEEEVGYMRRRVGEMAGAVVRMREEHRVCMLGRRVEMLERRDKEWGEVVRRREREKLEVRIELERLREENRRLRRRMRRRWRWWGCCGSRKKGGGFGGCLLGPFLAL